MTPLEISSFIQNIVVAVAAGVTAEAAYKGLKTWREQLHGTAEFDVARRLARATFNVRDKLRVARSSVISPNEFMAKGSLAGKGSDELAKEHAHVYGERMKPVFEAVSALDAEALEAEALWGSAIRRKADNLKSRVLVVHAAMETHVDDLWRGGALLANDPAFAKIILEQIRGGKDTDATKAIDAAVDAIEEELKPHLRRR